MKALNIIVIALGLTMITAKGAALYTDHTRAVAQQERAAAHDKKMHALSVKQCEQGTGSALIFDGKRCANY